MPDQNLNAEQLNNPHFVLYPTATNRTAWKPFGFPMILVSPHSLDLNGNVVWGSEISSVRILIETDTSRTPVSGHKNRGVYIPDQNIYSITLNMADVIARQIDLAHIVVDANNQFEYTSRTGIYSKLDYISHAQYFDLSDVTIETEHLPNGRYTMVYEATFGYRRISSDTEELICVDASDVRTSRHAIEINHPGDVIRNLVDLTPPVYFTSATRAEDTTISFYRPFTDIMQDVYDEQNFLEEVNWIYNIQPQYMPYLSYLLGWELPNIPSANSDIIRRMMLRNIVRLQGFKGTKRVVRELFDIFNTIVDITHVWWTPDGKEFIGVNESSSDGSYTISATTTATTEPILYEYNTDGFGNISAPLINRPYGWTTMHQKSVVLRAILVKSGSAGHSALLALDDTIGAYDYEIGELNSELLSTGSPIEGIMAMSGVVGTSTILIDNMGNSTLQSSTGSVPVSKATFDYSTNGLAFNFNNYIDFTSDGTELFVYATYGYYEVYVPSKLTDLRSNRFDVELFNDQGGNVDLAVLPFMIDYLFKVKAFHSLLRKIIYTLSSDEVYQVTDMCFGGDLMQRPDMDMGKQQVPPEAVAPLSGSLVDACMRDATDLGYRAQDLAYRKTIMDGLLAEFEAWKALGSNCSLNYKGQDRTKSSNTRTQDRDFVDGNIEYTDAPRPTLCNLDGSDYCYKGRVADLLINRHVVPSDEIWKFSNGCTLGLGGTGSGVYYEYTVDGVTNLYFDNEHKFTDNDNTSKHLATFKPPLGIQKSNLFMPGHRLPTMGNLESDFTHSTLKLRPWDLMIECQCPTIEPSWLNAELVTISGDEYLVYDDLPYSVVGNGLVPDISSLSDQTLGSGAAFTASDVVHEIYSAADSGNTAISFDTIMFTPTAAISTDDPLFSTAIECGSEYDDFVDGYPASSGYISTTDYDVDYFPASVYPGTGDTLEEVLGIPEESVSVAILFTLSSNIRSTNSIYAAYRLDCGCLSDTCGSSENLTACNVLEFINEYGQYDFNPDRVVYSRTARLDESKNTDLFLMDHLDIILMELKQLNGEVSQYGRPSTTPFPDSGAFTYKDSYGTIYYTSWKLTGGVFLDVVVIAKEPRVWGVSNNSGRVVGHEIYRTGIITTTRTVLRLVNNAWTLVAEGSTSEVGEFKSTYVCGVPFIDPFVYKVEHGLADAVEYSTDGGYSFITEGPITIEVDRDTATPVLDFIFGT